MDVLNRLTFLFGSGISIPAGLLSTDEMTATVLTGDSGSSPNTIARFLEVVQDLQNKYFQEQGRYANYEDLYYACKQLSGHKSGNFENPLILPFTQQIGPLFPETDVYDLAEEAAKHIAIVVVKQLSQAPRALDHLSFIYNACVASQYDGCNIFTLNHDRLLETYLQSRLVEFVDGFGQPINGSVRCWHPELFQDKTARARLFKLHGSLDWYRMRPDGVEWEEEVVGISSEKYLGDSRAADGRRMINMDDGPLILIGTFNKMLEYNSGIFLDLLCQFHFRLRVSRRLIVCGYGFGDKGINTQIVEWLYRDRTNRLFVIHPDPDGLASVARGAIANKWNAWRSTGKLIVIPKYVQDLRFNELQEVLTRE
jgi:hypothetical protein